MLCVFIRIAYEAILMSTHNIHLKYRTPKRYPTVISIVPPGVALTVTFRGSNYRCLEQIFMVPKGFEPSKFDCIMVCVSKGSLLRNVLSRLKANSADTDQTPLIMHTLAGNPCILYKQSILVISKSKGLSEIFRDIHISTYQICRIEETR